MPGHRTQLGTVAERVLQQCIAEGVSGRQARLRLHRCGVMLSERSVCRRLAEMRRAQQRLRDLEAIGRGLASVQIGAAGAAEILRVSLPGARIKQAEMLRGLFNQFLQQPTAEGYAGIVTGMFSYLVGAQLTEAL